MKKLISYELKNSKKSVFQIMTTLSVVSIIIQAIVLFSVRNILSDNQVEPSTALTVTFLFGGLAAVIGIGIIIGSIFSFNSKMANLLKIDLYEDSGYTTLSLPANGNKVMGAKVLAGSIWSIVLSLVLIVFNILLFTILSSLFNAGGFGFIINELLGIADFGIKYIINKFGELNINHLVLFLSRALSIVLGLTVIFASVFFDYRTSKRKMNSGKWIIYSIIIFVAIGIFHTFAQNAVSGLLGIDYFRYVFDSDRLVLIGLSNYIYVILTELVINILFGILLFLYSARSYDRYFEK